MLKAPLMLLLLRLKLNGPLHLTKQRQNEPWFPPEPNWNAGGYAPPRQSNPRCFMTHITDDLIRDEGFEPYKYKDSLGKWTIGVGFLIDGPQAEPMPLEVAHLWLLCILRKREAELDTKIPWWRDLDEPRQRALLNMSYQLGVAGLLKFKKMLKALEEKRFQDAHKEALDSKWAAQTPQRANRIAILLS